MFSQNNNIYINKNIIIIIYIFQKKIIKSIKYISTTQLLKFLKENRNSNSYSKLNVQKLRNILKVFIN